MGIMTYNVINLNVNNKGLIKKTIGGLMANLIVNILYVILFVAIVVFLDFKYFRYEFWKRLIVNILIVLLAVAFYYLFLINL